ncbi:MAG TPA: L,D-transpeptidase family protein [Acidimicrobiia bacterium]|nr:L,D-transpeptidase family protein [Acidimicrobiia bacterium]
MRRLRHRRVLLATIAVTAVAAAVATVVAGGSSQPAGSGSAAEVLGRIERRGPMPGGEVAVRDDPTLDRARRATVVSGEIAVRTRPSTGAPVAVTLGDRTELGAPTTFLVEETHVDPFGAPWYRVLLPTPPNGSEGWVAGDDVTVESVSYRIEIHLSQFRLDLVRDGDVERSYPIGVGTDETPTPDGHYYVKEVIELTRPDSAYGSHALALNGFSEVLTFWRGGGMLGIHGTNRPDSIGTQASHGCIRMHNEHVAEVAALVVRGTPVKVFA